MIDHLIGRPSPSWKRAQVFLVIFFWVWRILRGNSQGPRILWLRRANRALSRFTPWQIFVSALTGVYALRNVDKILGLNAPEPLANLYSPSYYRATWITTGLDAGFATAMSIRPKWMRDLCSILFSVYYIIYANEADEKLRRFRAVPTVEMLRTTWEKTSNPYIRALTPLPSLTIRRKILLPRPKPSYYDRPITAYLYFAPQQFMLSRSTDLILDFPGGGFIAMSPEHHEDRLRMWAVRTRKPVLSIDYGKAPEYPYPFAVDEAFDTYRVLVESAGKAIGMSGQKLNIILSGDSAGATLVVNVILKILEDHTPTATTQPSLYLPKPVALVLNYAALDFNFTSWMTPDNLRVLRSEQSTGNLPGLKELVAQKDHLQHVSPLSMVGDKRSTQSRGKRRQRRRSWRDSLIGLTNTTGNENEESNDSLPPLRTRHSASTVRTEASSPILGRRGGSLAHVNFDDIGALADCESDEEDDFGDVRKVKEEDQPIEARVRFVYPPVTTVKSSFSRTESAVEKEQEKLSVAVAVANLKAGKSVTKENEPVGTRLTMTSRTGYFQDRIVSPAMMRAMALLYLGPHRNPDFSTDYHISPILTPSHLLAQFPPLLMQCGEKDPFVDDTVIFAGRLREAKRARKTELDLVLSGKSARFGEALRMSTSEASGSPEGGNIAAMRKERDQLAGESEGDWVQMVLFSDWSHGYLQMPMLMSESKAVIDELADWIDDAFRRLVVERKPSGSSHGSVPAGTRKMSRKNSPPLVKPQSPPGRGRIAPRPFISETETETETDDSRITFVPKRYQAGLRTSEPKCGDIPSSPETVVEGGRSSGSDLTLDEERVGDEDEKVAHAEMRDFDPAIARPATPKSTLASKTGQTITETELMRRRRLLDAHMFE